MASAHRDVFGVLKRHGYTESRKIGEGSFGKALLVTDSEGMKLVCKMVDVSQASTRETQDAVKEGKLLGTLKHPYIVRHRESFMDSGWLSIVMDFCEGGDLTKQIEAAKRRRAPFSEELVLRWHTQAMLAIKYIHDRHVLHRDLKPSNFFLSKSGNVKMGDFGIAKVLASTMACARTQIGTPYYLSPEVCQEKPYTWPSDIWAMGCILYECCALRVPFEAASISGLVQKICRGPTPIVPPAYSDFVRQLCTEMLCRSAKGRPTAEDILARPKIQSIVKMMLDEAQAGRLELEAPSYSEAGAALRPDVPDGQYAGHAGGYKTNDLVEYLSSTHRDWLPATVLNIDGDGRIIIDLKPSTWLSKEEQAQKVRPRRRSEDPHRLPHSGPSCPAPISSVRVRASPAPTPSSQRGVSPGPGRFVHHDESSLGTSSHVASPHIVVPARCEGPERAVPKVPSSPLRRPCAAAGHAIAGQP
eukprot:CAMPEP_0194495186 /NCGR_PEP_ID=MMETSP0253-20130528/12869_1 /TAXON_ID=2966 /ORGANISM="Noctiluca scintillans" /LENGTH=471 /DNA_ID=CAMNT_0039336407 /DNA_START=106 /DNA_END=1521 /DNA_ORIENTATION=-